MAEITAGLVKQLREKTGAGMMDCKKALTESAGDIEAAEDWLRKKGISTAAKKAGRTAAEGLIGVATLGTSGAVVEVNAETDFVARNETFQGFVSQVSELALEAKGDIDALKAMAYPGTGRSVAEELTEMVAKIGENMAIRRCAFLSVDQGTVAGYMHNKAAEGLGKIGVLVALESTGDAAKLGDLGKKLAMHISFADPQAIDVDGVEPALVERERNILVEQARASGKPEEIVQKMVDGRLRKFYEEICLLEQTFAIDGETKVRKVIDQAATELGSAVKVAGMVRFKLGEGIERETTDFAAEVAAQLA